jgi:rhodanese-related sulfurtransferase
MGTAIGRDEVRRLLDEGAQLIEVLPAEQYEPLHLPGALNLPLKQLADLAPRQLDRGRPVIVYCANFE